LKNAQAVLLRHASITTTGNVYVQGVEESVIRSVDSHAIKTLYGWVTPLEAMGLKDETPRVLARCTPRMQVLMEFRKGEKAK
jgi:hypothetical protein